MGWQTEQGPWVALKLESVTSAHVTGGMVRSYRVNVQLKSVAAIAVKCTGQSAAAHASSLQRTVEGAVKTAKFKATPAAGYPQAAPVASPTSAVAAPATAAAATAAAV